MAPTNPGGSCQLLVHSEQAGFTWLWTYPRALYDLRRRWPALGAVQRSLQKAGPMPPPGADHGEFDTLEDASLGTILAYADSVDARMNVHPDGVKVIPKGETEFALPWTDKPGDEG